MNLGEAFEVAQAILLSLGGGAAIVLALSSWLGKVWASRLMEGEKAKYNQDLEELKIRLQEQLSINEVLRVKRMKLYLEYLEPHIKFVFRGPTKYRKDDVKNIYDDLTESVAHFTSFEWKKKSLELALFASDEVVEAWLDYYKRLGKIGSSYQEDRLEISKLFGIVLLAVRKDLGNQDTNLSELDMLSALNSKSSN